MAEGRQAGQQTDASGATDTQGGTSAASNTGAESSMALTTTTDSITQTNHDALDLQLKLNSIANSTSPHASEARKLSSMVNTAERAVELPSRRQRGGTGQLAQFTLVSACNKAARFLATAQPSSATAAPASYTGCLDEQD
ncbi:hypothetical protein IAT40_007574 [Kwoniella sp. CBS 6097]